MVCDNILCLCKRTTSKQMTVHTDRSKNKQWFQIFMTISGALVTFSTGQMMGWASPSLPVLMSPNKSPLITPITSSEASWIASLPMIGNILGAPIVAITVNIVGRKKSILFSAIPLLISWSLIYFSNTVVLLYIARFLGGFGESIGKSTLFMYVAEIAEPHIRGALGTILAITLNIGILYEYILGPLVSFRLLSLLSGLIPITLFLSFLAMPESPYYLLMRGQTEEARKSLIILRRNKDVEKELNEIKDTVDKRLPLQKSFKQLFGDKTNRYTLLLGCVLFLSMEMSGISPNIVYAEKILIDNDPNAHIESDHITLSSFAPCLLPILKTIATIITTFIVDRVGRRPLFMMSCLACSASMFSLSGFFYFRDQLHYDVTGFEWLPLVFMLSYNVMFIFGLGCLPFIMIGELFSTDVKAVAVCMTAMTGTITSASATKLFQIMTDSYGIFSAFSLFGSSALVSFFFVLIVLPETKNKTLAEIHANLRGKSK